MINGRSRGDIIAQALKYMKCKEGCNLFVGMYCSCGKGQAYEQLTKLYVQIRKEEKDSDAKSPLVVQEIVNHGK